MEFQQVKLVGSYLIIYLSDNLLRISQSCGVHGDKNILIFTDDITSINRDTVDTNIKHFPS
jgi:hypothetical protein